MGHGAAHAADDAPRWVNVPCAAWCLKGVFACLSVDGPGWRFGLLPDYCREDGVSVGAYPTSRDRAVLTSGADDRMISFNWEISMPSS